MPESAISLPVSVWFEVNQGLCLSAPCDTKSQSNTNDEEGKKGNMIRNFGLSMQKKDTQMQRWRKREAAWTIMLNVLDGFCC